MLFLLVPLARAQDVPDDGEDVDIATDAKTKEEDWGFATQKTDIRLDADDDVAMHDFVADERKKAPPPDRFHLDLMGKVPFADNYEIQFDAFDARNLVVELPVMVAISRAQFQFEHPNGVVVIAEISAGSTTVVATQQVTAASVWETTPTLLFFKTAIPNTTGSTDVRFLVKVGELPAPPVAGAKPPTPPAPPAAPKEKFARTTVIRRP